MIWPGFDLTESNSCDIISYNSDNNDINELYTTSFEVPTICVHAIIILRFLKKLEDKTMVWKVLVNIFLDVATARKLNNDLCFLGNHHGLHAHASRISKRSFKTKHEDKTMIRKVLVTCGIRFTPNSPDYLKPANSICVTSDTILRISFWTLIQTNSVPLSFINV